jgi:hypothetical protein
VFGETELIFDSYFGDENVDGTFVGPFNGSLQELLSGELAIIRHGTGQFQGMVMQGMAIQDPPGVQTETGEIFGR